LAVRKVLPLEATPLPCVCICMYVRSCVCMYVLMCVYMYVCMHVLPKYVCIYVRMYVRTYICMYLSTYVCTYVGGYIGCPRRNVPDFGRVFLMLKYTDITQNTYVQSWTVTEIMAIERCGLLAGPRTVPVSWQPYPCPSLSVVSYYSNSAHARNKLLVYFLLGDTAVQVSAWHSCHV